MTRHLVCIPAIVGLLVTVPAGAQTTSPPASGYRYEFLHVLDTTESHLVRLAEAIPADKYTWRPAQGVRSISEVFLHIATANFATPVMIGGAAPAGFRGQGYETSTTDKARVVAALKESFAHLRRSVLAMSDADREKPTRGFLGPTTYQGALQLIYGHLGEHLGQSIAYARINGIVPPWNAGGE